MLINNQVLFYGPSNAICSKIPTVKNFKTSFFHWYVFPFQLVQSGNTEFLFNKDTSKLKPNKVGLFGGLI